MRRWSLVAGRQGWSATYEGDAAVTLPCLQDSINPLLLDSRLQLWKENPKKKVNLVKILM